MKISPTLAKVLEHNNIEYDIVSHQHIHSSIQPADSANIPSNKMVKTVILEDDFGYVMALVPANQYVKINKLNIILKRNMGLAIEEELNSVFSDCDKGAIPPIGSAYGIYTVVDYDLDDCDDVYIESGNHAELLHLSGSGFSKLMAQSKHANIGMHT